MYEDYQYERVIAKMSLVDKSTVDRIVASKKYKGDIPTIAGVDSPDLCFVKFVLVSEHENANGDYFSREELVQARNTPLHKPVDIEHIIEENESYISGAIYNTTKNTIVGHMVYSAIADKSGNILSEDDISKLDMKEDPNRPEEECLDLIAFAVLYDFYFPRTVADISMLVEGNEIFVSMECWFKGYSFMSGGKIINPKDKEEEASLLKDWMTRKEVAGKRVCRVLKNVLFGGVGVTKTPANAESVFIKTEAANKLEALKKRHKELHILQSVCPSDEYVKEHLMIEEAAASLIKEISKNG